MKKSVRLYIGGLVQGIFFRGFIKENAEKHNLRGFVRNLDDGRVEVFLEGDTNDVNRMVEVCHTGPRHSKVKDIKMKPERFQGFKVFKILHI